MLWGGTSTSSVPNSADSSVLSHVVYTVVILNHFIAQAIDWTKCLSTSLCKCWNKGLTKDRGHAQDALSIPLQEVKALQGERGGLRGFSRSPRVPVSARVVGSTLFAYLTLPWFRNLLIQICKKAWGQGLSRCERQPDGSA